MSKPTFTNISVAQLHSFLSSFGWRRVGRFGSTSSIWTNKDQQELVVPNTEQISDFDRVCNEIARLLSGWHDSTPAMILRSIELHDADVLRFRSKLALSDGSVAVDAGIELIESASEILRSAACATNRKQPSFRTGRVEDAKRFMSGVRLGQTEVGSFVVKFISPVSFSAPSNESLLFDELKPVPFERKVTETLSKAVSGAIHASEIAIKTGDFEVFDHEVENGLSANLCTAISNIVDSVGDSSISISWSRKLPPADPTNLFELKSSYKETLLEGASRLKQKAPPEDKTLVGFVSHCDRKENEATGKIAISTVVDDSSASVKAELGPEEYEKAVAAHKDRKAIKLSGQLSRVGERWHLSQPYGLEVIL